MSETYWSLVTDPAHILSEATWDLVVFWLITKAGRRFVLPRFKRAFHRELDAAHGIEHDATGKARDVDSLLAKITELEEQKAAAVQVANYNAAAFNKERETATELRDTLQSVLKKPLS